MKNEIELRYIDVFINPVSLKENITEIEFQKLKAKIINDDNIESNIDISKDREEVHAPKLDILKTIIKD